MGIYATGQAYEQLILHLIGHPLPEARRYGELILAAVGAVMPSFVSRVPRPDRGGAWAAQLQSRRAAGERWAARLGLDRADDAGDGPSVRLLHVDGDEDGLLAALLFEAAGTSEERTRSVVAELSAQERGALLADLVGERANRRHRPGRGFEAVRYRFEIVSDYGAFRDLQRHRLLTVQWQALTPDLGAGVPEEVTAAGAGDAYAGALERSQAEYARLVDAGQAAAAPVRAVPRLPHPLRAGLQRPRGDAPDRAALRARGPSRLPRRRPRAAPPDRRRAPRGRGGDDPRRHEHRAAAGADPLRDAPAGDAARRSRAERARAGGRAERAHAGGRVSRAAGAARRASPGRRGRA